MGRTAPAAGAVAAAFGLGGTVGEMVEVSGAWSNRVYRLTVGERAYAVKEMRNPWGEAGWGDWLSEAWRFELLALEAGVRAPEPVPNPEDGACLATVPLEDASGEAFVRVHHWVGGRPADLGPASGEMARWSGETLALLHGLEHRPQGRDLFPVPSFDSADRWPYLVNEAKSAGSPWASLMGGVAIWVQSISALAREDGLCLDDEVMTHGDVDQKNVVIGPDGPYLCDWDVAAPLAPRRELADVAMSMAAWDRSDVARLVVSAYRAAGGDAFELAPRDLGQSLMIGLDWIVLNVERALRLRAVTDDEEILGRRLVPALLERLPTQVDLAMHLDKILAS